MLVFAFINFILYPSILRYQAGTQAGRYLEAHPEVRGEAVPVAWLLLEAPVSYSFEFDAPGDVARVHIDSLPRLLPAGGIIVFAPTTFGDSLAREGFRATPIQHFDYFHISQLTGEFINYRTRAFVLTPWELFRVTR